MTTKSVLVASIMHTGTMFVMDSVLGGFVRRMPQEEPIPRCKYQIHLSEPDQELLSRRMNQCVTITPLRERSAVECSWRRRGMDLRELDRQWEKMLARENVFRLQIDAPDRDEKLSELSDLLEVPLSTDWAKTNSYIGETSAE